MSNENGKPTLQEEGAVAEEANPGPVDHRKRALVIKSLFLLVIFAVGVGSGFVMDRFMLHKMGGASEASAGSGSQSEDKAMDMMHEVNPPDGYKIPALYKDVGRQLVAAGAIDMAKFTEVYKKQNKPLTNEQMDILSKDSALGVVITPQNAYFLLNFFWALGLTNDNPILTEGPMSSGGKDRIGSFASTSGWTLGSKNATELFSSRKIMTLTEEQQLRLAEVAAGVFRPCCDNPTHFPDCNHGMAMLGLLELMASQGATTQQMYDTAKYVNAFWYPQQNLEIATAYQVAKKVDFADADSKEVVSSQFSSGSGFQAVHQWLSQNGLLQQAPSSGGSCGVQ